MRRVWRTVVNTLKGAGGGSGSDTSRVRRLDDAIASATAQLRGTTADVASVNPRIDGVLQQPVKEIVKGRSRLEIRKLANAAFNGEGRASRRPHCVCAPHAVVLVQEQPKMR